MTPNMTTRVMVVFEHIEENHMFSSHKVKYYMKIMLQRHNLMTCIYHFINKSKLQSVSPTIKLKKIPS